jgi:hypothetical protein
MDRERMNSSEVVLGVGVLCIGVGAFMYPDAASAIRPEFKSELTNRSAFWHSDWFVAEAQSQIRRARAVQLTGVGLITALVIWDWLL